jgi:HEAT repeat protein
VEPLSEALLTDPDESVRREAAFALAAYRENAGAQRSLANAMRNDSSAEVRLAAQMSTMDSTEQRAFARERLHDRDLMPFERLGPTALLRISSLPPRGPRAPPTIGDAEMADALAIAEVISLTDDPEVKIMGLGELQGMFNSATIRNGRRPSPEVTRVMIDSTRFDNIEVRRSALTALLPLSEDPEVRAALEAAVGNQPELAARLRIPDVLARSSPAGSPPR